MVKYFLLPAITLTVASCNFQGDQADQQPVIYQQAKADIQQPDDKAGTEPIAVKQTPKYVDSFMIEMDSLMDADIKLPPIYSHEVLSSNDEATSKFSELAKVSRGKMKIVVNGGLVAKEVVHTVNTVSVPGSDLLILIDKTYSMHDDINNVKESLQQILDTVRKYKGTRLAVAFYGDKNTDGMEWYSFRNFETDYQAAGHYITHMSVTGGGDMPESVYDAVIKSLEQNFWRSQKKRNIILVGDAPPLEKPLSDYTISDVVARAKQGAVVMNFYPIIITPEVKDVKLSPAELARYKPLKLTTALYPNPSRGHIDVGFEENGTYYMEIYNTAGEMVVNEEAYGISWGKDLGEIPNGMYILRVINKDHKFELIKFILQR